ncbi:hypothetical protein CPC08DRAFT_730955 [Agrocybe pediades]|nr:hypothetical protein CPC08DRAFT_730955 [Agrocybe pediades]
MPLQVIINSDDKDFNSIRPASFQSSWTSSKGRKDVDTWACRNGLERFACFATALRFTSTTYFERVKNIDARWRRTDLDSCGSSDMQWPDAIHVLNAGIDKLPYKYHRNTPTTFVKVPISSARTSLVLSPTLTVHITHSEPYLMGQKVAMKPMEGLDARFIL